MSDSEPTTTSGYDVGVGPWQGRCRANRTSTRSCSPRATGATSSTVTGTGGSRRSSPTSTRRRHPFHVAIENWQHDLNIGSVVRTANAFLAAEVHIVGNRRWNRRGAMVTDRYQHVRPPRRPSTTSRRGRRQPGFRWSASTTCPGAVPLETYRAAAGCVLLFGQEGPGLSRRDARAACGRRCSIAQFGSTRSINAGAAAAIAMHAWVAAARRTGVTASASWQHRATAGYESAVPEPTTAPPPRSAADAHRHP